MIYSNGNKEKRREETKATGMIYSNGNDLHRRESSTVTGMIYSDGDYRKATGLGIKKSDRNHLRRRE
jgi:hypothetical protein